MKTRSDDDKPGRTPGLYGAIWRWHFYAGLFVLPFMVLLAVTGCGAPAPTEATGSAAVTRAATPGELTGIDLSDECIEQAHRRAPHIEYIAGDLFTTPLPQGHFDVVVSQDVVAHVVDQTSYIALAAGLLQPGGHLIISTTNRHVAERMDRQIVVRVPARLAGGDVDTGEFEAMHGKARDVLFGHAQADRHAVEWAA